MHAEVPLLVLAPLPPRPRRSVEETRGETVRLTLRPALMEADNPTEAETPTLGRVTVGKEAESVESPPRAEDRPRSGAVVLGL